MQYLWENPGWEATDPHLLKLKAMPFERELPPIPTKNGIYFIRGPRQIGKSSFLKKVVSYYAKLNAKNVGFLYCDELKTFQDLKVAITPFIGRDILILDEISFVEEWWRTIKSLADQNSFKIIILTGSNTWDIKQGADLMPGRWGHGGEIELLPMNFFEFKKAYQDAKFEPLDDDELLNRYFWNGGFPITLKETSGTYAIPLQTIETMRRWILGDAIKLGKNERYLKDILYQIALTTQTPLSLQKLAQKGQIGSHHTAIDYIAILESTFCAKILYAFDPIKKNFQYKKDKKFYFRDPIYFHLAYHWNNEKLPADFFEKMAESSAYEFLNRRYPKLGFIHQRNGEVDFIVPEEFAIEVKYSDKVKNLSQAYHQLQMKKDVWQKNHFFKL